MPGHRFQKGHHIGRPKGSKDKKYLDLKYWYDLIMAEYNKLTPVQRANIGLKCWSSLVNKLPGLPTSPSDSLKNTESAINLIKALENNANIIDNPNIIKPNITE